VGWLGVHPWLIALEEEYVRSTLIWWYACHYIRVDFMYVGMLGLGILSLADCSGRRVHKIDPCMVTYYDCMS